MGAGVEVDVGADESGELAYTKAGLDGHYEQRMVALLFASVPGDEQSDCVPAEGAASPAWKERPI